jgi:hypothetical protein
MTDTLILCDACAEMVEKDMAIYFNAIDGDTELCADCQAKIKQRFAVRAVEPLERNLYTYFVGTMRMDEGQARESAHRWYEHIRSHQAPE